MGADQTTKTEPSVLEPVCTPPPPLSEGFGKHFSLVDAAAAAWAPGQDFGGSQLLLPSWAHALSCIRLLLQLRNNPRKQTAPPYWCILRRGQGLLAPFTGWASPFILPFPHLFCFGFSLQLLKSLLQAVRPASGFG